MRSLAVLTASFALLATSALACPMMEENHVGHHGHAGHNHAAHSAYGSVSANDPAPVKAYKAAMHNMHKGMDIAYTGNPDADFTLGMIPHHQGAIDMANVVLEYGKDPEIKKLARWITYMQEQEIAQMRHWLNVRGYDGVRVDNVTHPSIAENRDAMEVMHRAMDIDYTGNADSDFARGMIPHHQGAIDMAAVLLKHGKNPELRKLAWDIIRSQKQEIRLMENWLAQRTANGG